MLAILALVAATLAVAAAVVLQARALTALRRDLEAYQESQKPREPAGARASRPRAPTFGGMYATTAPAADRDDLPAKPALVGAAVCALLALLVMAGSGRDDGAARAQAGEIATLRRVVDSMGGELRILEDSVRHLGSIAARAAAAPSPARTTVASRSPRGAIVPAPSSPASSGILPPPPLPQR